MTWLLPLLFGTVSGMLMAFPLAAWLSTLLLLRASRVLPPAKAYAAIVLALSVTAFINTRGLAPVDLGTGVLMAVSGALVVGLVFLADRLLHARLNRWAALLLFPAGLTFLEFSSAAGSPFGSWGSLAYSQFGVLPLMQLASVTGIWGITFLIALCATVVNLLWQEGWRATRPVLATYLALLAVVGLYGFNRLMAPLEGPNVQIAGLTVPTATPSGELLERALTAGADAAAWQEIEAAAALVSERLLDLSAQEASGGARIILWSEGNALVPAEGESALLDRARRIAGEHDAYLAMALATVTRRDPLQLRNHLVLVGPQGVLWDYDKAKLVPGVEDRIVLPSTASIPVAETPFGRISGAICFDTDFPPLLYEAGKQQVALLLSPARDWAEIDPLHTQQAIFRAIEQGFTIVRQAHGSWSVVADPRGRVLAELPHSPDGGVMRANVPVSRLPAPYTDLGDLFPFACMIAFVGLVGTGAMAAREGHDAPLN